MEYDVDQRIVLSEHEDAPYSWSLSQIDAEAGYKASNETPWSWTLWFNVEKLDLYDTVDSRNHRLAADEDSKIYKRRTIKAKLRPSQLRGISRRVQYSFFGTRRTISEISLSIEPLEAGETVEYCDVWGGPGYTAEHDFRQVKRDDELGFILFLQPETIERFAAQILAAPTLDASFSVGRVPGFYSAWSPSVTTDSIKVLGDHHAQPVEKPEGSKCDPLRLGRVGEFRFALGTLRSIREEELTDKSPNNALQPMAVDPIVTNEPILLDPQLVNRVSQLAVAAWIIVALLAIGLVY